MKKFYILLIFTIMFISISFVSAAENTSVSQDMGYYDNDAVHESILNSKDTYLNDSIKVKSDNVASKVSVNDIKSHYGDTAKYSLKVLDKTNTPIEDIQVTFKIKNKIFKVNTDSNGVASLNLNYPSGKYTINYSVGKLSGESTYTVLNKVSLTILKWGNKGDVSKIKLIKKNILNNVWVKKAITATKKDNPLLKFVGGKGKVVFITAGVHGNELSSQVAAMKLIKYLSNTPIKGTVYMIPFVNIKAISHKVRHTGADYNRIAHKSGTIPNKIIKLVVKYKSDAYGDFHTTKPGGIPGKNIVVGSKMSALKCLSLVNYIAKYSKVHKKVYKYAGQQYPGALADNVNKHNIPGVICEVMLPHNIVTLKTVNKSYSMMQSLLKFNSII